QAGQRLLHGQGPARDRGEGTGPTGRAEGRGGLAPDPARGAGVNFEEAFRDLDARQPESMPEPSLDRIRAVADLLDHPELTFPSIHITGTNGKTTTARLVTALACAHGLTAGTFTSPHLVSVTDRLMVCGEPIEDEEFAQEYERLRPYLELVDARVGMVTYFEALTGLA